MARTGPRSPRCPDCNAPFALKPGQTHYTCGYCGIAFDVEGTQARPPVPRPTGSQTQPRSPVPVIMAGVGFVFFLMITGAVFALRASPGTAPPRPAPTARTTVIPPVVTPEFPALDRGSRQTDLQWASRTAPTFVDINGDGTDDIIGHVRRLTGSQAQDLVAAFDGRTLAPLWETPPSEGPDASRTTKVIAHGGRLVMSEQRAVNLLEAETGKRLGRVPLSDSPRRLCIPPGDTESVWVQVVDGQHLLLNTRTGTARPALQAPPRCATPPLSPQTCSLFRPVELATTCERSSYPPSDIRGFSPSFIYRNGDAILVTGTRTPGTSVPMAALFQKGTKAPLWHGVVADTDPLTLKDRAPEVVELTTDAAYLTYEVEQGGVRLVRRDVRTGAMVWDVAIPRSKDGSAPEAIWAQGSRVYVPHWTWMDVFEADTGSLVGTIGRW